MKVQEVITNGFWLMPATPKFVADGIPYITSKNIKEHRIKFDNVKYISEEDYIRISVNRPIKEDDILISMIGTLGEVAAVRSEFGKFYGQNIYTLRLKNQLVDKDFFIYFMESKGVKQKLESNKNKSTQGYLKAEHIENLELPNFSINKQKEIVFRLNSCSRIIRIKQIQIEKMDTFIKSRFVEMFGDRFTIEQNKIDEIAAAFIGLTYKPENIHNDGIIVLRSGNVQNGALDLTKDIIRVSGVVIGEHKYIKPNDILLCSRNGSAHLVGKCCLIRQLKEKMTFGAFMTVIRTQYPNFLYCFFQSDYFKQQLTNVGTTSINQITTKMLKNYDVIIPTKKEEESLEELIQQIDKLKFIKLKGVCS